jgi:ABC-type nitrate/sulfonate/bicarbonate transport system substrate-binding protein
MIREKPQVVQAFLDAVIEGIALSLDNGLTPALS